MRHVLGLGLALALISAAGAAAGQGAEEANPDALKGAWTVDLSTDPAKPYQKPMVLALAADGTVSGSFYDSAIEAGRWKTDRGRTASAFAPATGRARITAARAGAATA